jgi:hypothetical protein
VHPGRTYSECIIFIVYVFIRTPFKLQSLGAPSLLRKVTLFWKVQQPNVGGTQTCHSVHVHILPFMMNVYLMCRTMEDFVSSPPGLVIGRRHTGRYPLGMPRARYRRQIGLVRIIASRNRPGLETDGHTDSSAPDALTLIPIFPCWFRNGRLSYRFYRLLVSGQ